MSEELFMNEELIVVCGDVLSRRKSPKRILLADASRETNGEFHVTCGSAVETCLRLFPKATLLNSYPELACVMGKMEIGDEATREDTTDGPLWAIKDTKGVVRHTILSPKA
jgi:hypothetical protein